jgi:hypothetical protein
VPIESNYDEMHKDIDQTGSSSPAYSLSEEDTANLCLWIKVRQV